MPFSTTKPLSKVKHYRLRKAKILLHHGLEIFYTHRKIVYVTAHGRRKFYAGYFTSQAQFAEYGEWMLDILDYLAAIKRKNANFYRPPREQIYIFTWFVGQIYK